MTTTLSPTSASTPLRITVGVPGTGTVRVALAGEVDLATAPALGVRLLALVQDHRPVVIDVDLAEVTFLDCAGIGVMVTVRAAAVQAGCRLWITRPRPIVAWALDLVGLLGVFTAPQIFPPPVAIAVPRLRPRPEGVAAWKPAA